MLLPCAKCYRFADEQLSIRIGNQIIEESICQNCVDEVKSEFEQVILQWTLQYFNERVIHQERTPYNLISVTEDKEAINLRSGISLQSGIYKQKEGTPADYLYGFVFGSLLADRYDRILCVGLGAGFLPGLLQQVLPGSSIDVVEIDERMLEISQKYFGFRIGDNTNVWIEDAQEFLKRQESLLYDIVILDAYDGYKIPEHLNTSRFLSEVKRVLKENGIVLSNLHGKHDGVRVSTEVRENLGKFKEIFTNNYMWIPKEKWELNLLLLSTDCGIAPTEKIAMMDHKLGEKYGWIGKYYASLNVNRISLDTVES